MVPVISSKAQRMLELSVAGNLMILEKIARRQSGGHIELLPENIALPMSQLYFYGISCLPKGQQALALTVKVGLSLFP